jgi:CBS domain-containing protein/heme-degrading monooxygenase HmoA
MNAWLTARRVKKGKEEEFRKKWRGGDLPEGMIDAFLLEDEEDPRETLSVSLWDSAEKLLAYRTGDDARKRQDDLTDVVDKDRWSRTFVGWNEWDLADSGGKKKLLLLPLLLVAAGAAAFVFLKRRSKSQDLDWENWESEPAETYQPEGGKPPVTATTDLGTAETRPRLVHPMEGESGQQASVAGYAAGAGTATALRAPSDGSTAEVHTAKAPETGGHTHMASTSTNTTDLTTGSGGATATQSRPMTGAAPAMTPRSGGGRTVRDLMTARPETVDTRSDAATAAQRMRDLNVGVVPVMAAGRHAGVVTDRDLALGVAQRGLLPRDVLVGDLMTDAPLTVSPDISADEAARLMAEQQIRRLPVVEGDRLVGIIALGDLSTEGAAQAAGVALHEISEPAEPER